MKSLLANFKKNSDSKGRITKVQFEQVMKKTLNHSTEADVVSVDRIFDVFDVDKSGFVDFVELATGLSGTLYTDKKELLKCKYFRKN